MSVSAYYHLNSADDDQLTRNKTASENPGENVKMINFKIFLFGFHGCEYKFRTLMTT